MVRPCLESNFAGRAGIGRRITLWTIPKNKTPRSFLIQVLQFHVKIIMRALKNVQYIEEKFIINNKPAGILTESPAIFNEKNPEDKQ